MSTTSLLLLAPHAHHTGKPPNAEAVSGPSNPEAGAGEPPNAGLAAIDECPKAGSAGAPKAKAASAADDDCPYKLMK